MATDLLTTIRGEIEARLSELRPALEEYENLISAEQALGEGDESGAPDSPTAPDGGEGSGKGAGGGRARYSLPGRRTAARVAAKARSASTEKARSATTGRRTSTSPRPAGKPRSDETERGIMAALEHGSHTASELVMVTAFTAQSIRRSLTRLERAGTIGRTRRNGQTAYVLASTST